MTTAEKLERIKNTDAETLLQAYEYEKEHFNPLDDDRQEWYCLLRAEIINRLTK